MVRDLNTLMKQIVTDQGALPPVHAWEPDFCGDIDIRITREGEWLYMNSPIGRAALVKLFSSVIRLDPDGDYYLVTPVEKLRIQVDVAPFVAIDFERQYEQDQAYYMFTTKEGYQAVCDEAHPIRWIGSGASALPLIRIRHNLDALIHRNLYYALVECAEARTTGELTQYGIMSGGVFMPLEPTG